ncbi:hypothetical protein [Phenylobacterium sp.]|uniref:hypothetical protein n=1 Tax=Phenylobacterium sp. TaxID=1871053 RepID=UPI0028117477|nr:hypothetical protein [Phenylobacterium sp.]
MPGLSARRAAEALRTAGSGRLPEVRRLYGELFASLYSEAELQALVALAETPAGAVIVPDAHVAAMIDMLPRNAWPATQKAGRAAFCRTGRCLSDAQVIKLLTPEDGVGVPSPVWSETPSEAQIARVMPPIGAALGLTGYVRMTCRATGEGLLDACKVAAEAPAGLGYGVAALQLVDAYRLAGAQVAQGAAGETVAVIQAFPAPELDEGVFTPPPPRSDVTLAMARELVSAGDTEADDVRSIDAQIAELQPQSGSDPEAWAAARSALREGMLLAAAAARDELARIYAASFSEVQLREAAIYARGPVSRGIQARLPEFTAAMAALARYYTDAISEDAGKIFCRAHDCTPPPPQPAAANPEPSTRNP